jgi:translation initiation factor 1
MEMANSKLVWTSDPEQARKLRESGKLDTPADADASKQIIRVATDKKRRAGKTVTVATGFQLTADSLAALAQTLKKRCGSGGTAKENEIEIQGDHVARVAEELRKLGYRVK